MANEISLKIDLKCKNPTDGSGLVADYSKSSRRFTQTTAKAWSATVTVGTSEEDLAFLDIATPGLMQLTNLDGENFVTWGPKDTTMTLCGILYPGRTHLIQLEPTVTLRWKADTANVEVLVELLAE